MGQNVFLLIPSDAPIPLFSNRHRNCDSLRQKMANTDSIPIFWYTILLTSNSNIIY